MEIKNDFCAQFSSSSRVKGFWSNPIPTKRQIGACNLWPGQIELSHCSSCRSVASDPVASGLKKKNWMDDLGPTVPPIEQKLCIYHALKCALVLDWELQSCSSHCSWHNQNTKINASLVSGRVSEMQWNKSLHFETYPLFLSQSHSPKKERCVVSMVSFLD